MGMKFKASKRVSVPLQCRWCERIQVGSTWVPDRRTVYGRYSHGVCPACGAPFFPVSPADADAKTPDPPF
jgi:hypothetical protein